MYAHAYAEGLKLSSQGRHFEAISCFETALAAQPDDIAVLFALGNTAQALGMHQPAAEFFRKVLAQEPGRIEALINLANLLRAQGQFEGARALLESALARHSESPELRLTLGSIWREAGDREQARHFYRAALELRPDYDLALSNLADLLAGDGDFEAARTLYDRALKAGSGHAQIRLNRAILHFQMGNLAEGWRDYAARTQIPNKVPATDLKLGEWRGTALDRTRLLVRAEQGVGDQLMFMSLIPDLLAHAGQGRVILECEARLAPLAARSFPAALVRPQSLATVNGVVKADYGWLKKDGGANCVTLMGSLPRWLRKTLDAFPKENVFLTPDPKEQALWKNIFSSLTPSPLTGICWRSGKSGGHRSVQYAPLEMWGAFLRDLPGRVVSCQYDASAEEIAALEQASGRKIFVPPALDQKNELDRTAAMLSALDCVISAPTAVSWLAAGVGVRTIKLNYHVSWTAFGQAYEPFAPTCISIGPKRLGDWNDTFAQAAEFIARPATA
jgi:tetratricopeptide (TPR) repeat protein